MDIYSIKIDVVEAGKTLSRCKTIGLIPSDLETDERPFTGLYVDTERGETVIRCSLTDERLIVTRRSALGDSFVTAMHKLADMYGRPVVVENEDGKSAIADARYEPSIV